ncbi:MAG: ISAs1 family transposase [Flavobacteriaceae bacterium]|nr:ISAs1 family transposase [Flavobacteriaceae bacterium]RZW38894.1 MAG: ISAs1 family transposase [Flavobacteriaceae bacterium]
MKGLSYFILKMDDPRRKQGTRYPFDSFIMMILLANMSGYFGQNEIFRFIDYNKSFFIKRFNLPHGVPAITRVKTFLRNMNYQSVQNVFDQWASQFVDPSADQWVSIDGKCLASTVSNANDQKQNYISIVTMYAQALGVGFKSTAFENKKGNEIQAAIELIESIEEKGYILTLDALHCQKKRSKPSWIQEMSMWSK